MTVTLNVELPDAYAEKFLSIPEGAARDTFVSDALRAQLDALPANPAPDFDWERIPEEKREAARRLLSHPGYHLGGVKIAREDLYDRGSEKE